VEINFILRASLSSKLRAEQGQNFGMLFCVHKFVRGLWLVWAEAEGYLKMGDIMKKGENDIT